MDTANVTKLEAATKRCWKCETTKPVDAFSKDKSRQDGLQPTCKPCSKSARLDQLAKNPDGQKKAWAKWYAKPENAAKHNAQTVKRNREYADALVARFKNDPCFDCKQTFVPAAMEFDHRPGTEKQFNLNVHGLRSHSLEAVMNEMAKCDLVCANCHRVRTMARNQVGRKG
jgi:hypothetical protein